MLNTTPNEIALWTEDGRDDGAAGIEVRSGGDGSRRIVIDAAPAVALTSVALRWDGPLPEGAQILGDHWERGYGDLEWRGVVPERVLPWYALTHDARTGETHGFGVETGAASFASWRVDETGVTLVLDIRNGGRGVRLGGRRLEAAIVRELTSQAGETPFAAARRLCRALCPAPRLPHSPVYGGNDWYFRYGANTAETVRRDSALVRELSPAADNAPTFVIDAGWSPGVCDGGPYDHGTRHFPDMAATAEGIRSQGVRPGIWIRPLLTTERVPEHWCLAPEHPNAQAPGAFLDPSVPDVLDRVRADIGRLRGWGYGLIKHDFTTYDITGRWGFEMTPEVTPGGWAFADRSRTTAEIVRDLYAAIREAAGDAVLIGCNTVGHLGAGCFELQRTGDDTSGRHWERTRKMGVNTLAFRMPQHGTFFAADADCVGLTRVIPWERNRQWLDLLARSGTPLFVSADPDAVGPEQRAALRQAFGLAARPQTPAEPLDWLTTTCPRRWRTGHGTYTYDWAPFPGAASACPP
jgi:alpha-galactosidase